MYLGDILFVQHVVSAILAVAPCSVVSLATNAGVIFSVNL